MDAEQVKALIVYLNVGMKVLSARVLLVVSMLLTFSLFAWAMYFADAMRLGIAATFGVLVFLPSISLDKKEKQHVNEAVSG